MRGGLSVAYFCKDGDMLKGNPPNTSLKDRYQRGVFRDRIATDERPLRAMFGSASRQYLQHDLNQDFLFRMTDMQNLIVLLVIALVLGLLLPRLSIVWSLAITGIFLILYIVGAYFLFDIFNYIVALATPVIQVGFMFTLIITYRVLTEQREKRYIRQTFSKFVSKRSLTSF